MMIKLIEKMSGFSRLEQFLPKLFEFYQGDLKYGEIFYSDTPISFGELPAKSITLEAYLIDDFLKLSFSRKLHEEELRALNLLASSILKNLIVISRLRKVSYKGWNRKDVSREFIFKSESMKACVEKLSLVAPHLTTVLLQGETGTGKELLAKFIHDNSDRSRASFVTVNCGALPEAMLDSALFGHVKGAFTGADKSRKGCFEKARGGTLFLDEIGDLPLETQTRLLRVIEYGDFTPLGSDETVCADVRIVVASHKSLKALVSKGKFRQDLYYRLSTFPIEVPPLRNRCEDIPGLIDDLVDELRQSLKIPEIEIDSSVYKKALNYTWPGNVRELKNVLEKSMILAKGSKLKLLLDSQGTLQNVSIKSFDEEVKALIQRALFICGGRVDGEGGAAELLNLKPQTLYSKIRKYSIEK